MKSKISDNNPEEIRIRAVLELGNDKSQKSKELLIQTLSTVNSFVRDAVVKSLVKIGDRDFLCENIIHEHRYVRRGLVQALGELGGSIACKQVVKCLEDKEWGVRMYAAEALGKIGGQKHITFLKNILVDAHEWPRQEANKSLEKLNNL